MNLTQLRYAAEVEKAGSISRAAQNLFMGQPNLSKAIRELESEIGLTLFRRTPHGVEPTGPGAQFLTCAKTILFQFDELESLYKPHAGRTFHFFISAPPSVYGAVLADFLSEQPPGISMDVRFKETSGMEAFTDVASGESDLAIVRVPQSHQADYEQFAQNRKLSRRIIWEFHMALLMSRDHPLASWDEIPCHLLDGFTEICTEDAPPPAFSQIRMDVRTRNPRRRVQILDRDSQFEMLRRMPGAYMWVSPIPVRLLSERGLVMKKSGLRSQDWAVYKEDHTLSPGEKRFLELAGSYTREFSQ